MFIPLQITTSYESNYKTHEYNIILFTKLFVINIIRWIEACIEEELPLTTELEEALRTGVILCKLGHWYAPEKLPMKKIYDLNGTRFKVSEVCFLLFLLRMLPMFVYRPKDCILNILTTLTFGYFLSDTLDYLK